MFDEELHKENVFCAYLLKLLPPDEVAPLDLEGKLQLEYYKLQKTFAGAIELEHAKGVYEPVTQKGALGHDPKEPLDEIILKINEKFKGEFTNADRVLLTALHDRLLADPKLAKLARSSDPQIFTESIFPKAFDTAAQDSYLEAQDTFASLFEDTSKYKAIMSALAEWLYGEFRKKLNRFPFCLLKTACIHGMRFKGLGVPQQAFCNANGVCIDRHIACRCRRCIYVCPACERYEASQRDFQI